MSRPRPRRRLFVSVIPLLVASASVHSLCFAADPLDAARKLRLTGRYQEAIEAITAIEGGSPTTIVELAKCHLATGVHDKAQKLLREAAERFPESTRLKAELARLCFDRGDYEEAREYVDEALKLEDAQLLARWLDAELHRVGGRLEEADKGYRWFVRFYNQHQKDVSDPDDLRLIGLAAAQYARWNRNSSQFSFLVNRLLPQALKLDDNYWPAHLESALLFLEKYNDADAAKSLDDALAINSNAAEVHAARARLALQKFNLAQAGSFIQRALEINPKLIEAHNLKADLLIANFQLQEAAEVLEASRKVNPVHEETLGKLAAVYGAIDGLSDGPADTRMGQLIAQAVKRNEHCGQFFFTLAAALEDIRKFPHAAIYYEEAQRRMPQLIGTRGRLGLMYMRLGEEVKAAKFLDESFKIDPFNVRVKNMLAVLEVLDTYAVIETDHFIVKFDRGADEVLAKYAARYLEDEVYPELVEKLGYEPKGKSLFEIFSRYGRTSGHSWFSARMVGLPYVGTVGACAGKMVAIASPNDVKQPYNWSRVLKHEFVHVVNLQQTNFNIPHWFTEALAVWHEGYPRPALWNEVLLRRSQLKKLYNLNTINFGFARPGSGDDWTLAYCQAELYAEYMIDRHGDAALAKMLKAYADNLSTRDAIQHCFGENQEGFEDGYQKYVEKIVEGLTPPESKKQLTFAELQEAVKANPRDADLLAQLALGYLQRGSQPQARRLAIAAREVDDKSQLAGYVLARVYLSIGDASQALELLENSFDESKPQENALALLAGLRLKAEAFEEAARLYELGLRNFADDDQWLKALARVYLTSGDDEKLESVLEKLTVLSTDDPTIRKKLAQLALNKGEHEKAAKWAGQGIQINVQDAEVHAMLAECFVGLRQLSKAIFEYETAIRLDPDYPAWHFELAKAYAATSEKVKARLTLEKLLDTEPGYPGAKKLLENLSP